MKITVRRDHIASARRKDSHHCMIVDAIKEQTNTQFIMVDTQSIRFSDPETRERYVYFTPPKAQEAILRWDRGVDVQPFVFDLNSPVKITPIRKTYTGTARALNKARAKYDAKRASRPDPMAPRLVKRGSTVPPPTAARATRFREFGVRRLTKSGS